MFLLNYVSKSRDFLYVSRDLFFAPILAKKNLKILQSRVFLSLVSEREPKNLLVVSSAPPPNAHHDFIKKYISLRLCLDMSSLNSSPVEQFSCRYQFLEW